MIGSGVEQQKRLLDSLLKLPKETEWVEFKQNNYSPEEIGEYISALANSAALVRKDSAYILWGIENETHQVVGTDFHPLQYKIGNEELENWLARLLSPRVDFSVNELEASGKRVVIFEITPCQHTPVRFRDIEYIRVGSYKKKLKDFPEKERALWLQLSHTPFEFQFSATDLAADRVLSLLDYPSYFDLTSQALPDNKVGILDRLEREKMIVRQENATWSITNLGALLFAKRLAEFEEVARKAVRVIIYKRKNRSDTVKEQVGTKGYAAGFEGLVSYINDQVPRNEQIGIALRTEARMYPELAFANWSLTQ